MKIPAAAPTAAPLASRPAFWVISALASAISSLTSSWSFSLTSWTAWPRSEGSFSATSVHQSLEDAGDQERAGERGADQHLRAVQRPGLRRSRLDLRAARGGGDGRRVRLRAQARRRHPRARQRGRRLRRRRPLGLLVLAGGLRGVLAGARRLLFLALRLLTGLGLPARELLLLLLRLLDLLVGVRRRFFGAPRVGLGELGAQLRLARLGTGALLLRGRLARGGGRGSLLGGGAGRDLALLGGLAGLAQRVHLLCALRILVGAHSGGSSPKIRRNRTAASRVVTIEANAPVPASSPDHARRLTRSLWFMARESINPGRRRWSRRRAPWPARRRRRPRPAGRRSSRSAPARSRRRTPSRRTPA